MPTDQRKLNDGEQGSGSGLDADKVDAKESSELEFSGNWSELNNVPELIEGVSEAQFFKSISGAYSEIGRLDFTQTLNQLNYPFGFYDNYADKSKISSNTALVTTGAKGEVTLSISSYSEKTKYYDATAGYVSPPTYDVKLLEKGFISLVTVYPETNGDNFTVKIKDGSGNVLSSKSQSCSGETQFNFSESDYSDAPFSPQTFTIEITGDGNCGVQNNVTYSGTTFEINSGDVSATFQSGDVIGVKTPDSYDTSASVTHTDFTVDSTPTKWFPTADFDENGQTYKVELYESSTDTKLATASSANNDFGTQISISTSETQFYIKENLSGNGTKTPVVRKTQHPLSD